MPKVGVAVCNQRDALVQPRLLQARLGCGQSVRLHVKRMDMPGFAHALGQYECVVPIARCSVHCPVARLQGVPQQVVCKRQDAGQMVQAVARHGNRTNGDGCL